MKIHSQIMKRHKELPLQLPATIRAPRRSHSVFDNVPQLRRLPQEFFMNPEDAKKRYKDGDISIKSRHGKVLRPVSYGAHNARCYDTWRRRLGREMMKQELIKQEQLTL